MKIRLTLIAVLAMLIIASPMAGAKDKKKQSNRGMLESMQSVPCGVKEHGITGLGSVWASAGIQHVNSDEKLCAQYLFRTDEMDYHIRPEDMKHAVLLPIGHEGVFKIKKDRLYLKVEDSDKKTRAYQVVSMEPKKSQGEMENTSYRPANAPTEYRPPENPANRQATNRPAGSPPATPPPQ
jgi:hypothetical protein